MRDDVRKTSLFESIAVVGKAFASPVRLQLIDLLAAAPRTVDELAHSSGLSRANVSQHLRQLYAARVVTRKHEGTSVRYSLAGEEALRLWLALRHAAARLVEVERAAREPSGEQVEVIGPDELIERLARGDVVLVDVRPHEEFAAGHLEGARCVPLAELERRLAELPTDREVVVYCAEPFCTYARQAVRLLHAAGRRARRLEDGLLEWRLAHNEPTSPDLIPKPEAARLKQARNSQIATQRQGKTARAVLSGELDIATAGELDRALTGLQNARPERILLDLSDLTFMDVTVLNIVRLAAHRARQSGIAFVLAKPQANVRRLFELTGSDLELDIRGERR